MLIENTLLGEVNKIDMAVELLKMYEPIALKNNPNGYYVAFSNCIFMCNSGSKI